MKITNLGVGVGFIRCNFFQSPSSYIFFLIFQLEIVFDTQKSHFKKNLSIFRIFMGHFLWKMDVFYKNIWLHFYEWKGLSPSCDYLFSKISISIVSMIVLNTTDVK